MSNDAPSGTGRDASLDTGGTSNRCVGSLAPAGVIMRLMSSGLSTSDGAAPQPHQQGAPPPRMARCRFFGTKSGNMLTFLVL
jgi:hypothetical protein